MRVTARLLLLLAHAEGRTFAGARALGTLCSTACRCYTAVSTAHLLPLMTATAQLPPNYLQVDANMTSAVFAGFALLAPAAPAFNQSTSTQPRCRSAPTRTSASSSLHPSTRRCRLSTTMRCADVVPRWHVHFVGCWRAVHAALDCQAAPACQPRCSGCGVRRCGMLLLAPCVLQAAVGRLPCQLRSVCKLWAPGLLQCVRNMLLP